MTKISFDEPSAVDLAADNTAGLKVRNKGTNNGEGVRGEADWVGVVGVSSGINERDKDPKSFAGVLGDATHENGAVGVMGRSINWIGVAGFSKTKEGVRGEADWVGVVGVSKGGPNERDKDPKSFAGVLGDATHEKGGTGVMGRSKNWIGVEGISDTKAGVHGTCNGALGAGVEALNTGGGFGIVAEGRIAGLFKGDIEVTGDIRLLNADCAEDFDVSNSEVENIEAGTVMVLNENGSLQSSHREYDKKVAGIVSGARGYKPGIILDRQVQLNMNNGNRLPIALMGKVYCKVDARQSPIEIGDLLTTSSTKGYAMKAGDPYKAFGSVIGKALGSLKEGLGMIPVLVALQ